MRNTTASSTVGAIVRMKCPKCRQGNLFCESTSYNINTIDKMPEQCTVCGQRTEPETGFYYGAMFINYGFAVLLFAVSFWISYGIYDLGAWTVIGLYVSIMLLTGPWLFRYSRVLYLNIFVRYRRQERGVSR